MTRAKTIDYLNYLKLSKDLPIMVQLTAVNWGLLVSTTTHWENPNQLHG
jgi:hypothetical protein